MTMTLKYNSSLTSCYDGGSAHLHHLADDIISCVVKSNAASTPGQPSQENQRDGDAEAFDQDTWPVGSPNHNDATKKTRNTHPEVQLRRDGGHEFEALD